MLNFVRTISILLLVLVIGLPVCAQKKVATFVNLPKQVEKAARQVLKKLPLPVSVMPPVYTGVEAIHTFIPANYWEEKTFPEQQELILHSFAQTDDLFFTKDANGNTILKPGVNLDYKQEFDEQLRQNAEPSKLNFYYYITESFELKTTLLSLSLKIWRLQHPGQWPATASPLYNQTYQLIYKYKDADPEDIPDAIKQIINEWATYQVEKLLLGTPIQIDTLNKLLTYLKDHPGQWPPKGSSLYQRVEPLIKRYQRAKPEDTPVAVQQIMAEKWLYQTRQHFSLAQQIISNYKNVIPEGILAATRQILDERTKYQAEKAQERAEKTLRGTYTQQIALEALRDYRRSYPHSWPTPGTAFYNTVSSFIGRYKDTNPKDIPIPVKDLMLERIAYEAETPNAKIWNIPNELRKAYNDLHPEKPVSLFVPKMTPEQVWEKLRQYTDKNEWAPSDSRTYQKAIYLIKKYEYCSPQDIPDAVKQIIIAWNEYQTRKGR